MRLTFKANNPFTGKEQYYPDSVYDDENTGEKMVDFNKQTECNNKLGQLEDLEDELGIDLITLFKAYTNGFYVKGEEIKQYIDFENCLNAIAFKNKEMFYGHKWTYQYVKLSDYGKTWALTKGELL